MSVPLRPVWLRPLALVVIVGLHAALLVSQRAQFEALSPVDEIEVGLVSTGDDSAEDRRQIDEITPAAPTPPLAEEPPAPPPPVESAPAPELPSPDAIPLPVREAQPPVEPRKEEDRAMSERDRQAAKREPMRKQRENDEVRRRAQKGQQAARRGSSSGQMAGGFSRANYAGLLMAELNRHRFYPAAARAAGATGAVGVAFTIGPSGRVASQSITQSSGFAALDSAARTILASIHAPPPPGGSFFVTTMIRFHLN